MRLLNCRWLLLYRQFSASAIKLDKKFELKRQGKILAKLMTGSSKKSLRISDQIPPMSTGTFRIAPKNGSNSRRVAVLNALLMESITDVMSTGEISHDILGFGIEISRVEVTQDFSYVKVYWVASGTAIDSTIQDILQKNANKIRAELCGRRVLGNVPLIIFVKDKSYVNIVEVENLLKIADFGEDFVPSEPARDKTVLRRRIEISQDIPKPSQKSNSPSEDIQMEKCGFDLEGIPLPVRATGSSPSVPMKMDVYGLDHEHLMKQVILRINQSKGMYRGSATASAAENEIQTKDGVPSGIRFDKSTKEYDDFLAGRRKQRYQQKKLMKNVDPNKELMKDASNCVDDDNDEDSYPNLASQELDYFDEESQDYIDK